MPSPQASAVLLPALTYGDGVYLEETMNAE